MVKHPIQAFATVFAVTAASIIFSSTAPAQAAVPDDGVGTRYACTTRAQYGDFLDRYPRPDELIEAVTSRKFGASANSVPNKLALSDEWLGLIVHGIYEDALDRTADVSGLVYWIDQLRRGARVNTIGANIYGSAEFYTNVGGTNSAFVSALYTRILGRSADSAGLNYWVNITRTHGRAKVAFNFFKSVESRTQRVQNLYNTLLGRSADSGGLAYWVNQLLTINDVRLAVQLAGSAEYEGRAYARCNQGAIIEYDPAGSLVGPPTISDNGRYVAFDTPEPIVVGDIGTQNDIFLLDRSNDSIIRIAGGNGFSGAPIISADGNHVAFSSEASDLVPGDTNTRVDAFMWDRSTNSVTRIAAGNRDTFVQDITSDGNIVLLDSEASNLGGADANGTMSDVFLWKRDGTPSPITKITNDANKVWSGSSVSDGGLKVTLQTFDLNAETDFGLQIWDASTGALSPQAQFGLDAVLSNDGDLLVYSYIDFIENDEGQLDFLSIASIKDLTTSASTLLYGSNKGDIFDLSLSADENHVALSSSSLEHEDATIALVNRATGASDYVGVGTMQSGFGRVNGDGTVVVFNSAEFADESDPMIRMAFWFDLDNS